MPGRDGTGPLGYGPKTGRGLGRCVGYGNNNSVNVDADRNSPAANEAQEAFLPPRGWGRGYGMGRCRAGFGFGRRGRGRRGMFRRGWW